MHCDWSVHWSTMFLIGHPITYDLWNLSRDSQSSEVCLCSVFEGKHLIFSHYISYILVSDLILFENIYSFSLSVPWNFEMHQNFRVKYLIADRYLSMVHVGNIGVLHSSFGPTCLWMFLATFLLIIGCLGGPGRLCTCSSSTLSHLQGHSCHCAKQVHITGQYIIINGYQQYSTSKIYKDCLTNLCNWMYTNRKNKLCIRNNALIPKDCT